MDQQEKEWNRIVDKYPVDITNEIQCWLWCIGKNNSTRYFVDIFNRLTKASLFRYSSCDVFDIDNLIMNELNKYELV